MFANSIYGINGIMPHCEEFGPGRKNNVGFFFSFSISRGNACQGDSQQPKGCKGDWKEGKVGAEVEAEESRGKQTAATTWTKIGSEETTEEDGGC